MRLPDAKEWDMQSHNEGKPCDSSDYVDGWNDALSEVIALNGTTHVPVTVETLTGTDIHRVAIASGRDGNAALRASCVEAINMTETPAHRRRHQQSVCDAINAAESATPCQVVGCGAAATYHAWPANATHPDEGGMLTCDVHLSEGMSHMTGQPDPDHWRVFPVARHPYARSTP